MGKVLGIEGGCGAPTWGALCLAGPNGGWVNSVTKLHSDIEPSIGSVHWFPHEVNVPGGPEVGVLLDKESMCYVGTGEPHFRCGEDTLFVFSSMEEVTDWLKFVIPPIQDAMQEAFFANNNIDLAKKLSSLVILLDHRNPLAWAVKVLLGTSTGKLVREHILRKEDRECFDARIASKQVLVLVRCALCEGEGHHPNPEDGTFICAPCAQNVTKDPRRGREWLVWRHVKTGNLYRLHSTRTANFCSAKEEGVTPVVIYRALANHSDVWVRPLSEWSEFVPETGQPRFLLVGAQDHMMEQMSHITVFGAGE
jgi:hypothetical protein